MSETKVIDIKELKFDERNFNRHNDEGMSLLENSIKEVGFGRSIFLDKDNNIVGGNGVTEKALQLGTKKVRIIDTDGTELIAVRRTDLSLDSEKGRKAALADNSVGYQNLTWNEDELKKAQEQWGVVPEEWGVELLNADKFGEDFSLPSGERSPFQQMTFILAEEQVDQIKDALSMAKKDGEFCEFCGNNNQNGNALFLIVKQWVEQRK